MQRQRNPLESPRPGPAPPALATLPAADAAIGRRQAELRAEHAMYGKRKLAVLPRREGTVVSASIVGRIPRKLMDKGVVAPMPSLCRNPGARRVPLDARQRHEGRLP